MKRWDDIQQHEQKLCALIHFYSKMILWWSQLYAVSEILYSVGIGVIFILFVRGNYLWSIGMVPLEVALIYLMDVSSSRESFWRKKISRHDPWKVWST